MLAVAVLCLATNIFHEARGEPVIGQYAVAQVTMNRAGGDQAKVCKVVYQKNQFSWTNDPSKRYSDPKKIDPDAWERAIRIAKVVLKGRMYVDLSGGATHYHATYVRPQWRLSMEKTRRYGRHVFYATIDKSAMNKKVRNV